MFISNNWFPSWDTMPLCWSTSWKDRLFGDCLEGETIFANGESSPSSLPAEKMLPVTEFSLCFLMEDIVCRLMTMTESLWPRVLSSTSSKLTVTNSENSFLKWFPSSMYLWPRCLKALFFLLFPILGESVIGNFRQLHDVLLIRDHFVNGRFECLGFDHVDVYVIEPVMVQNLVNLSPCP